MNPAGILVLDLDGTVALGDEPVLEYTRAVAHALREAELTDAAEALEPAVANFLAGNRQTSLEDAADGYLATARLALGAGLDPAVLNSAYHSSREAVHAGRVPMSAPNELTTLLDELRPRVRVVLVSNAPAAGLAAVLDALGLGSHFDAVRGDAGKPDGMPGIIRELLSESGLLESPERLLSVGDIWVNDLEPVAAIGGSTAMVDRWGRGNGDPDYRAATIEELYPAIREWADRCNR